jgi:hypothetical protein
VTPGTRSELAPIEAAIEVERGGIPLLYQALLNSAPIAEGWEKMLTAVRNRSSLPAALRAASSVLLRSCCTFCGIGSCGVPRPSMAPYVAGTGARGGDRCRRSFVLPIL